MTSLRMKYNFEKYDEENPEILIEGISEKRIYPSLIKSHTKPLNDIPIVYNS